MQVEGQVCACLRVHVCLAPPTVSDPVQFPALCSLGRRISILSRGKQGYLGEKKLLARVSCPGFTAK